VANFAYRLLSKEKSKRVAFALARSPNLISELMISELFLDNSAIFLVHKLMYVGLVLHTPAVEYRPMNVTYIVTVNCKTICLSCNRIRGHQARERTVFDRTVLIGRFCQSFCCFCHYKIWLTRMIQYQVPSFFSPQSRLGVKHCEHHQLCCICWNQIQYCISMVMELFSV
jgi:hypothetical protein